MFEVMTDDVRVEAEKVSVLVGIIRELNKENAVKTLDSLNAKIGAGE